MAISPGKSACSSPEWWLSPVCSHGHSAQMARWREPARRRPRPVVHDHRTTIIGLAAMPYQAPHGINARATFRLPFTVGFTLVSRRGPLLGVGAVTEIS